MSRTLAHQFTVLCLRGRADATYLEPAGQLAARPDFDWDAFLRFAFEERLPPLLYHTLHGRSLLPLAVATRLRHNFDPNSIALRMDLSFPYYG